MILSKSGDSWPILSLTSKLLGICRTPPPPSPHHQFLLHTHRSYFLIRQFIHGFLPSFRFFRQVLFPVQQWGVREAEQLLPRKARPQPRRRLCRRLGFWGLLCPLHFLLGTLMFLFLLFSNRGIWVNSHLIQPMLVAIHHVINFSYGGRIVLFLWHG